MRIQLRLLATMEGYFVKVAKIAKALGASGEELAKTEPCQDYTNDYCRIHKLRSQRSAKESARDVCNSQGSCTGSYGRHEMGIAGV